MGFSLSTISETEAGRELARKQDAMALAIYGEKRGDRDWGLPITTDTFFQETAELRSLLQPETVSEVSLRGLLVTGSIVLVFALSICLPDWKFPPRKPVPPPRAPVPLLPLELMPVSTRQRADGFNKKCVESKWAAAWTELTALCTELPKETGEKPRQALRERLYLLAMNRAAGDLDESSQASVWTDLDNAEQALFPELSQAAKLPDEVLVAFLRVAHMRKVRPVLDKGMNSGKPVPSVSRKELSELGNEVRELQQRNEELSKDSRQRLDLVDAAVHLALVWTMTSTNLDAAVTVRRDPKPSDDSETGRWWDRLHEAIDAVEKEPSMSGQYEWKQLRKGFWQTIEDFTSNPFSKENISLGSWIYKEADVEDKLKAAQ